ncbi:ABC transporter, permease protein (cluster 9, phospholipid) [Olavius algarvensis associated proteobacterium Delta 3]|nr:ABC transporter, permease protein (cluster 9, phospholipid) [Olavius algarvensis associated proteobacterium Delta 3]CAB5157439.1 ABC transporter, permease protein (cluster 9, phospholipid) [Olavius algarvensis associated proteobacterium Delta 3]
MVESEHDVPARFDVSMDPDGECRLRLTGRLDVVNVSGIQQEIMAAIDRHRPRRLLLDLCDVTYLDDFGALLISQLRDSVLLRSGTLRLANVPEHVQQMLSLIHFDEGDVCRPTFEKPTSDAVSRLGEATLQLVFNARYLVSFLGSVILSFGYAVVHPRALRWNDTVSLMEKTGVDAVPIVALTSFLLGLVMAFMAALQLRQFGANIYVASLVAIAMVSELGPIMTAIIVAGRSGSAFAAEIGTMRISEEIDALYIMGFRPALFLAVPRILASIVVVPLLTLFSSIFAIAGGLLVGVLMLDLTAAAYLNQTVDSLTLSDFLWGFSKSIVFAAVISWIGCLRGFQVRGGAASVGNAATSAVVSGIFLIIFLDAMFAFIRNYG